MYFDDNLTTKRYVLTEFIGIGQNIATQIKEKRKTPEALIYQGFRGVFFNGVPVRLRAWGKEEQGSAAHAFLFAKRKAEQSGLCSDVEHRNTIDATAFTHSQASSILFFYSMGDGSPL